MRNENELYMRIKNGDKNAENELISTNIGLVKTIADKNQGVCDADDLIQVGCMALLRAARTYSSDKGSSFTTYASKCIRNAMTDLTRSEMRQLSRRADYSLDEFVPGSDERYIDLLPEQGNIYSDEELAYLEDDEEYDLFYGIPRVQAYMEYRFGPKGDKRIPRKEAAEHFHLTLDEATDIEREAFGWLLHITYSPNRLTEKERKMVEYYLSERDRRNDTDKYNHKNLHYWYWDAYRYGDGA